MKVTNYQSATIDPFGKGLGMVPGTSIQLADAARLEWNLLDEDVSLPAAVLYAERIEHNLKWMQAFVAQYGVKLAPHGKTTMAPQLFRRQLETGAWGITLATAHQVRAAYRGGVQRVLLANQLVGKRNMGMIAELLTDPNFEFFCLVDSADGVDQLGAFFSDVKKQLNVLIELGVPGGRTGVRDDAQREAVLAAIARWPGTIHLAGVELYEGVLQDESKVREFLQGAVTITRSLVAQGKITRKPAILSGAGSAWVAAMSGLVDFTASSTGRSMPRFCRSISAKGCEAGSRSAGVGIGRGAAATTGAGAREAATLMGGLVRSRHARWLRRSAPRRHARRAHRAAAARGRRRRARLP